MSRCLPLLLLLMLLAPLARADESGWFDDLQRDTPMRRARIDVAGPEPASFTTLGVAPFLTAQALAASDFSIEAAQVFDDQGRPRAALGVDFAPAQLGRSRLALADYQHNRRKRFVSRIQLSLAVSRGESAQDLSTRFAPTLRVVLHEQRDPRVHRGPGSLRDCFERRITPPSAARDAYLTRVAALQALDERLRAGIHDPAERTALLQQRAEAAAEMQRADARYRAELHVLARQGMRECRDDPEVAAYTWNATGHAIGLSPTFRTLADGVGALEPRGFVAFATTAYGFDALGTQPDWTPSFLGRHAQVLGQLLWRHGEPLPDPQAGGRYVTADQLAVSTRLRGGTAPWSANLEAALLLDAFRNGDRDNYLKLAIGGDLHLGRGTWLSLSIGRTLSRARLGDQTSGGLTVKKSFLD
jgi:hypothetical protein